MQFLYYKIDQKEIMFNPDKIIGHYIQRIG
jgi:quinolinate synthase